MAGVIEKRDEIPSLTRLCDHCLGRQFSLKWKGKPVEQVGAAVRKAKRNEEIDLLLAKPGKLKPRVLKDCVFCSDLFVQLKKLLPKLEKTVKKEEFNTFLIACKTNDMLQTYEEELWAKIGAQDCEPIKREINRIARNHAQKALENKKPDLVFPDVVFTLNFWTGDINVLRNALFIYGRYQKLERGIPQTKWPCRKCKGRGRNCQECKGTGRQYKETVEDLISPALLKATLGRASAFHGMGREDIDARMLGTGRPFVIEVTEPEKRFIELKKLEKAINKENKDKIVVSGLRFSSKTEVQLIKAAKPDKTYEAIVDCEKAPGKALLAGLAKFFVNKEVSQQTPARVLHRRADLTRKRKIVSVKIKKTKGKQFTAEITAQAGTYIKELVSGDNDRTKPSFTSVLKTACVIKELDVTLIHDQPVHGQ